MAGANWHELVQQGELDGSHTAPLVRVHLLVQHAEPDAPGSHCSPGSKMPCEPKSLVLVKKLKVNGRDTRCRIVVVYSKVSGSAGTHKTLTGKGGAYEMTVRWPGVVRHDVLRPDCKTVQMLPIEQGEKFVTVLVETGDLGIQVSHERRAGGR